MRGREPPIAKITRPSHLGVLPRKRLFSALDDARKKRAVWVCGPPGSGKTVLVSSYLLSRKQGCLWYRMDEGDGDPATRFHYLGMAAVQGGLKGRRPLPPLTPEYLPGLPVFARRFFEALCARMKPPFRDDLLHTAGPGRRGARGLPKCRGVLFDLMGVPASPETEKLYRSLMTGSGQPK